MIARVTAMNHLRSPGKVRAHAGAGCLRIPGLHHMDVDVAMCPAGHTHSAAHPLHAWCTHVLRLGCLPTFLAVQLSWLNSISTFVRGSDADELVPSRSANSKHLKKMVSTPQCSPTVATRARTVCTCSRHAGTKDIVDAWAGAAGSQ